MCLSISEKTLRRELEIYGSHCRGENVSGSIYLEVSAILQVKAVRVTR